MTSGACRVHGNRATELERLDEDRHQSRALDLEAHRHGTRPARLRPEVEDVGTFAQQTLAAGDAQPAGVSIGSPSLNESGVTLTMPITCGQ